MNKENKSLRKNVLAALGLSEKDLQERKDKTFEANRPSYSKIVSSTVYSGESKRKPSIRVYFFKPTMTEDQVLGSLDQIKDDMANGWNVSKNIEVDEYKAIYLTSWSVKTAESEFDVETTTEDELDALCATSDSDEDNE